MRKRLREREYTNAEEMACTEMATLKLRMFCVKLASCILPSQTCASRILSHDESGLSHCPPFSLAEMQVCARDELSVLYRGEVLQYLAATLLYYRDALVCPHGASDGVDPSKATIGGSKAP